MSAAHRHKPPFAPRVDRASQEQTARGGSRAAAQKKNLPASPSPCEFSSRWLKPVAVVVATGACLVMGAPKPAAAGFDPMAEIGDLITQIDLEKAEKLLQPLDGKLPRASYELARLAMYRGDCDTAAKRLAPPEVQSIPDAGALLNVSRDCMRAMAGTVTATDELHGVIVRFQDDADAALLSLIGETVEKQRVILARDLGVEMPKPTRIEVVRDQFSLSAMTGLPYEAARTTGTVAIAKWGRVIMISPRAPSLGYAWRDTLAHELTHLALSKGTLDRAPLWLQEGVAKREETRWRPARPSDDAVPADAVAAIGLEKDLGKPLDGIGPSIALLPSAQQAMVVYAEVTSFVRFISGDRAGEPGALTDKEVLPKLVRAYAKGLDTDKALVEVTGKDLKGWDAVWRPWVKTKKQKLPSVVGLDDPKPKSSEAAKADAKADGEARRAFRLGQLLLARDHVKEARTRLDPLVPKNVGDPLINGWAARARFLDGDAASALTILDPKTLLGDLALWWITRAESLSATSGATTEIVDAWTHAIAHDPLSPEVSCGWGEAKGLPAMEGWVEAAVRGLCAAARARHLPKFGQD